MRKLTEIPEQEFVEAFKETGITPIRGDFWNVERACGCAITALFTHKLGVNLKEAVDHLMQRTNNGEEMMEVIAEVIEIKPQGERSEPDMWQFIRGFDRKNISDNPSELELHGDKIKKAVEAEFGELE